MRFRSPALLRSTVLTWIVVATACDGEGTAPEPSVARTVVIAGADQVLVPGADLLAPVVVIGHGADGREVARGDLPLTWAVREGGGGLRSASAATNSNGTATALWTLGPVLGEQVLEVRIAESSPATVRAQAIEPGPIAFLSSRAGDRWDNLGVFVMDVEGARPVRLTRTQGWSSVVRWAPGGDALLYDRADRGGSGQLYLLELDGLVERQLTSLSTSDPRGILAAGGDWAPDGSRVVFSIKQPEKGCTLAAWNLWTAARTGARLQRLTHGCGWGQKNPDWSPDGSRIVFQQNVTQGGGTAGGSVRVMIMNADGSDVRTLASPGRAPRWSPDGQRVLYAHDRSVRVINADGTGGESLWTSEAGESIGMVAWSPSGTAILATVLDTGGSSADIYRYDLGTGVVQNLTQSSGRDAGVDWRGGG